jgi:hypothetical protein
LVRLTAWIREPPVWNQRLGDGGPDFRQLEPGCRLAQAGRWTPASSIGHRSNNYDPSPEKKKILPGSVFLQGEHGIRTQADARGRQRFQEIRQRGERAC